MRRKKHFVPILTAAVILTIRSVTVMAAEYNTPADIVAGLTGRTVDEIAEERTDTGKTYGTIADEAGKLMEFKEENLKLKERLLNNSVEEGTLSQEEADSIMAGVAERQAVCDGTGFNGGGCGFGRGGSGFGRGGGGFRRGGGNGLCIY